LGAARLRHGFGGFSTRRMIFLMKNHAASEEVGGLGLPLRSGRVLCARFDYGGESPEFSPGGENGEGRILFY